MARIRFAFRSLAKAPLLSLVVVLSLGLGIGANTAIFSLLHQIILRSLPVEKPEELVLLTSPGEFKGGRNSTDDSGGMDYIFSYRMFRELEKRAEGVTGLAAFRSIGANLAFGKQTVPNGVLVVSGGYFPRAGSEAAAGPHHLARGRRATAPATRLRCWDMATGTTSWAARPAC